MTKLGKRCLFFTECVLLYYIAFSMESVKKDVSFYVMLLLLFNDIAFVFDLT